jgi:CheY-like chemotaxis protein
LKLIGARNQVLKKTKTGAKLPAMGGASAETIDVLHVEDDDNWAELARLWIGGRGWSSKRVRSYAELVRHLNKHPLPRCLLLDRVLADADGLEVCRRIKSSPAWQSLPIVILTGDRRLTLAQCHESQALFRVVKGDGSQTEAELCGALVAILAQQDRSLGIVDADDLRLDPRGGKVLFANRVISELAHGPFAALSAMVRESPGPIADARLHEIFMERRPYHKTDPELTIRLTVRNYVYLLRRQLGPVGVRLVRAGDGYAYRPFVIDAAVPA